MARASWQSPLLDSGLDPAKGGQSGWSRTALQKIEGHSPGWPVGQPDD
jgi:hypothetical protein